MINIDFVDLTKNAFTFPSSRVGMVMAQPHLPRESLTAEEPFQLNADAKGKHISILEETLAVACLSRDDGLRTHFTILPEYCIPGLDGVQFLEDKLRTSDWPCGSVLIGGTDGLTSDQYGEICEGELTHVAEQSTPSHVGSGKWVNCAIIWIKFADGRLERWLQPKLSAAWGEANSCYEKMFQGQSIYVFKGKFDNGGHFLFW